MKQPAFDLGEHLTLRHITYYPSSFLWEKCGLETLDLNFSKWEVIKYLNDSGDNFNIEIEKVPNDKGGLYLFFVNCNIISGITELPFYVGRATINRWTKFKKKS